MGGCNLYSFQNTGATVQYVTGQTCSSANCVLTIQAGDTYWVNFNDGSIITDPDISQTTISTVAAIRYLRFSGVCSTEAFYFRADASDLLSLPFTLNDYYCFDEVFSCDPDTPAYYQDCFQYVSYGDTPPSSPYVTDVAFKMPPNYSGSSSGDCLNICPCDPYPCDTNYCITGTGTDFDGNYEYGGQFSGNSYWTGDTTPTYYIYNNGDEWCLSTSLGGTCLMVGAYPCTSTCPDICEHYLIEGVCPTPTPTPTINCDVLDFEALFDCEFTPTPTNTPTQTQTPTMTPTPSQTEPCGYMDIDVSISAYTPTPTPTPTMTPSPTPQVNRPFNFSGDVTFNTIDGNIQCPSSSKFQDCYNGNLYYTTNQIQIPGGGQVQQFMIFNAMVDGVNRCITFLNIDENVVGVNDIVLLDGPLGYSNLGECVNCVPQNSPTPTQTPTNTVTPTLTPTPTSTPTCLCVTFSAPTEPGSVSYYDCSFGMLEKPLPAGTTFKACVNLGYPIVKTPTVNTTVGGLCINGICK